MNFQGIIIAIFTFLIIGIFHPIVIKVEYHFSKNIWYVFLIIGIIFLIISLFQSDLLISSLCAIFAASSLWSINERYKCHKREKQILIYKIDNYYRLFITNSLQFTFCFYSDNQ